MEIPKLYLVVRADLSAGQQAVQAAHALQEFNMQYRQTTKVWHTTSNTLVLLVVPDQASLDALHRKAQRSEVSVSAFHEPDRGNEKTAIAIGPEGRRITKGLPLALR